MPDRSESTPGALASEPVTADDEPKPLPRPMEWDFDARFKAIKAVQDWLQKRGFRVTATDADEALDLAVIAYNASLAAPSEGGK